MIDDFGEKIGGARKDYASEYRNNFHDFSDDDISNMPLSKIWPEPDWEKLASEGFDAWLLGFIHASRDSIPRKPTGRYSCGALRYVEGVKGLRHLCVKILTGEFTKEKVQKKLEETPKLFLDIAPKIAMYMACGHEVSFKETYMRDVTLSMFEGVRGRFEKTLIDGTIAFGRMKERISITADSREEALSQLNDTVVEKREALENTSGEKTRDAGKFTIWSYRDKPGIYIGRKFGSEWISVFEFPGGTPIEEVRTFFKTHQGEIAERFEKYKTIPSERNELNKDRKGPDFRGGRDITPDEFQETFGLRGVEFGNWIEQKLRQESLNRTYDAMLDLAFVLGVSPKDLSLGSTLALSFGSRGKGGINAPSAHYEPGRMVINLTKKNGPGSLAHEWFHAFDNWAFRNLGGNPNVEGPYMSEKFGRHSGQEMGKLFGELSKAIQNTGLKKRSEKLDKRRTSPYWSTSVEMSARSFESFVKSRLSECSRSNDFLVNIKGQSEYLGELAKNLWEGRSPDEMYPFLVGDEIPKVASIFEEMMEVGFHIERESDVKR